MFSIFVIRLKNMKRVTLDCRDEDIIFINEGGLP